MEEASYQYSAGQTPVDVQDNEINRIQLLRSISLALVGLASVGGILAIVLTLTHLLPFEMLFVVAGAVLLALLIAGGTIGFVRIGRHRAATNLFLYGTVTFVTVVLYLTGGVTSPVFATYLIPVMVAGLLGKGGDGTRLFLVAFAGYMLMVYLQNSKLLVPINILGTTQQATFVTTFIIVGGALSYLAWLWSNSTTNFMKQVQQQSEAMFHYNQQLLEKSIQQVELGSELSAAAAEMLATAHQQASGSTQQASAVSEVSTTIEELGSTARQIAIASEQVAEAAQQTLENLSEGQDAVDNSIQAMDRIRARMQDISARVLNLGERSQQIGEIIDLINDLSDETHLLALNAAIEAAGAGEHGRRFAVVAAEVKSLANRALAAAKDVKGVIAEIQQATNAAVLAAEEGGKEVELGVDLAHRAGQVMDSIVIVAERTAQSGSEISLATAQQQSASEQVVETTREIAEVARQTASSARQMSEAAQTLTAIAERLHGISSRT